MSLTRRIVLNHTVGAALIASCLPGAALAATTKTTAYFMPGDGSSNAYLIDWQPRSRARVVNAAGAQTGIVTDDGVQKTILLDGPIASTVVFYDADCNEEIQQRRDTTQLVVRDQTGGITKFVEIGTLTNLGGCHDGQVTPFGSPSDEGESMKRLGMANRPPVADMVPGTQIAGFSEDVQLPGEYGFAEDLVTLQSGGTALFRTSGHVVPASFDANQWLVFNLGFGQRAYTRVALDAKTGGETWLMADWADGQATRVEEKLVVKPMADAGFGTVAQASRMWESGLFIDSRVVFFVYLYKDSTGERIRKDLDLGTESHTPITSWGFNGSTLLQRRVVGKKTSFDRSWIPLRNEGTKIHWVMESEKLVEGSNVTVSIKPRVNYYLDTGKAVKPTADLKATGFVSMHEEQPVAR